MKGGGKERDEGERISSTRKDNRGINPFHVGYVALSKWATGEFIRSLIYRCKRNYEQIEKSETVH